MHSIHTQKRNRAPIRAIRPNPLLGMLLLGMLLGGTTGALAQRHPPELRLIYPIGGRHNATTRVTLQGVSLRNASQILFDRPGIVGKIVPHDPAKLPAPTLDSDGNPDLLVDFTVSKEAAPGLYHFRVLAPAGLSNVGRWFVGRDIPDLEANKPNSDTKQAQAVSLPVAVNGRIGALGDQSVFAFDLQAEQTFVAEVNAAVVGSPLDSLLTLRDAEGREVASNDDYNGPDSLIVFPVKTSGRYLLTLSSSVGAGGPNQIYRLNLGYLPLVTAIYPTSLERGKPTLVTAVGVNLPLMQTQSVTLDRTPPNGESLWFPTPLGPTNPLPIFMAALPTLTVEQPNNDPAHAVALPTPGVANGRFWRADSAKAGAAAYFKLHAEVGHTYRLEAQCQGIGSRADPMLTVYDSDGKQIGENDDAVGRDSRLDQMFAKAGDYLVRVKEVSGRTAPDLTYRLVVQEAPAPGSFALAVETRARAVGRGDSVPFEVDVSRDRWEGPVTLSFVDLPPGLAGSTCVVPAGVGRGLLVLTAESGATPGAFPLHIVGTADVNGKQMKRPVGRALDWFWNGGARTTQPIPANMVQFAITEPVEIAPKSDPKALVLTRGQSIKLKVTVEKRVTYTKPIILRPMGLSDGITAADVTVPADKTEAEIEIKADPKARLGAVPITIAALATHSPQVQLERCTPAFTLTVTDPPKAPPKTASPPK